MIADRMRSYAPSRRVSAASVLRAGTAVFERTVTRLTFQFARKASDMQNGASRGKAGRAVGRIARPIDQLSVSEIAAAYRRRALSPIEVVDACLAAIEARNPQLNAFVTVTAEEARAQAREAEERLRVAGEDVPPLCGIPFSVKDTLPTAGVRTTFGSRLFADFVPNEDCAAVAAVKRAGGILLGKTNSPAFGWTGITHNKLFGATPNPWNPAVTAADRAAEPRWRRWLALRPSILAPTAAVRCASPPRSPARSASSHPTVGWQIIRLGPIGAFSISGPLHAGWRILRP